MLQFEAMKAFKKIQISACATNKTEIIIVLQREITSTRRMHCAANKIELVRRSKIKQQIEACDYTLVLSEV